MNIGMLGFGTVGRATVEVLRENAAEIGARAAAELRLVAIATRTPAKARALVPEGCRLGDDLAAVTDAPDVDVVVELIGGVETARTAVLRAIANGKHVVTANKALLARHGDEIFERAAARGVMVAYEAAVAVAIPIIKLLREAQAASRIDALAGIVNGTSNFVLTRMREDGVDYADAVADAQARGFAEADPSFDVDGNDAAHKLAILAALAYGIPMSLEAVRMRGIAGLSIRDVQFAEKLGHRIKLLAVARRHDGGLELRVEPMLVPHAHMMAAVNAEMNAILVRGNASGTTLHYGAGAGGRPTASAVVADLVDVARLHGADPRHHVPAAAWHPASVRASAFVDPATLPAAHYLRFDVADEVGVLASVTAALAAHGVSIDVLHQEAAHGGRTDLVALTYPCTERTLAEALADLRGLAAVSARVVVLPVEPLF